MIERERAAGDMVVLPVEGVKVTRNINLAIHKNKYLSKSIKMMQEIVQETF